MAETINGGIFKLYNSGFIELCRSDSSEDSDDMFSTVKWWSIFILKIAETFRFCNNLNKSDRRFTSVFTAMSRVLLRWNNELFCFGMYVRRCKPPNW